MEIDSRNHAEFFDEIREQGFHILSRTHASRPGFYPSPFPTYPSISLEEVQENQIIVIRAFFATSKVANPTIESGELRLEVEAVDLADGSIFANILTDLPPTFALAKGTSIELVADEVLSIEGPGSSRK